jgi:hypothetical protein
MIVVVGTINNAGHCLGFCAGEINMCFFHNISVHAFSISHTFVRYQAQFRLLSNFGRRSDFFPSHACSRKVYVFTVIEVCKHRCCLAPSQASARAEAEEVKLYFSAKSLAVMFC